MRMLDLFCGRWGWSKAFAARGWECVGVDLVEPPEIPAGCQFIKADVLSIYPSELRHNEPFDFICASPPCEEFSVYGMKHFHPHPKYPANGIKLFEHTRRICEESDRFTCGGVASQRFYRKESRKVSKQAGASFSDSSA